MKVLIGGDIYLGASSEKLSIENPRELFGELSDLFEQADVSLANLECPLTDSEVAIVKTGPNIKAGKECITAINYLNVDLVTLANNHIMDFGIKGLQDTLAVCEENQIHTVGAGMTERASAKPYIKKVEGQTVAIVNFAENEWASANADQGGANPMDVIENVRQIQSAKADADHVIVIVHGGHEHYEYPSPRMVSQYRFYVEQGASAIVGHHAHCVSGYEVYKDAPIFYNIGNLLFDSSTKDPKWFEGMLVELDINHKIGFKLIPYYQSKQGNSGVHLMQGGGEKQFYQKLEKLSEAIHNGVLERKWSELIHKEFFIRRRQLLSKTSKFYRLLGKLKMIEPFLNKRQIRLMLNLTRCEAHRDVSVGVLEMAKRRSE